MLTGYNTDIEYDGSTFHVQTEDKGDENPYIESLVYCSGEILYSRKTTYKEVLKEADHNVVASMMERQHQSIVRAVRDGMLEQLKSGDDVDEADETTSSRQGPIPSEESSTAGADRTLDEVILDYLEAQKTEDHLVLRVPSDDEYVYGAEIEVVVEAASSRTGDPIGDAEIEVVFKSTTEPRRLSLASGTTDENGRFNATAKLPEFTGGTSAVVIAAESEFGRSEIKQLVHR